MSRSTNKKKSRGNLGGDVKQFLVWHGEKLVVAAVAVFALYLAMQGLGYPTLPWQPRELEETAEAARRAIENSERTVADEELKIFDYAGHAEQIKRAIEVDPYRNPHGSEWNPPLAPAPPPTQRSDTISDSEESLTEPEESAETESPQDEIQ